MTKMCGAGAASQDTVRAIPYSTIQYSAVQHSTAQRSAAQYSAIQYVTCSTVRYLDHKSLDDSVEYHIVVVAVASQSLLKRREKERREK